MPKIRSVYGREVLDSSGNPAVETDVLLETGELGRSGVNATETEDMTITQLGGS